LRLGGYKGIGRHSRKLERPRGWVVSPQLSLYYEAIWGRGGRFDLEGEMDDMGRSRNEIYMRLCLEKDHDGSRSGILMRPLSIFHERPYTWEFGEDRLRDRLVL
jgi:hypothetical protein